MLLNSLVLLLALQSQLLASVLAQSQSQSQQQQQTSTSTASQQPISPQVSLNSSQQLLLSQAVLSSLVNAAATVQTTSSGANVAGSRPNVATNQQYVMSIIHNDQKTGLALVNILPLNQTTNLHEPRIELRYVSNHPYIELPASTKVNSFVAALIVNDEDSGPSGDTTVSLEAGNELGHFRIVTSPYSTTIQVASQLNIDVKQEYNLTIVARDHGSPPKSSSVNLVIKLTQAIPKPYPYNPNQEPLWDPSNKAIFADLMYFGAMLVITFSTIILVLILACFLTQRPKSKKGPPPRTSQTSNTILELY